MGAIAEAIVAYTQPLLDQTDGSEEQLERAFAVGQFCFNFAMMPEAGRDTMLSEMKLSLGMNDDEFDEFRRIIVLPMLRRHQSMFPRMHEPSSTVVSQDDSLPIAPSPRARTTMATAARPYAGTAPYAPCPCNSGRKYRFCCGKKVR